MDDMGGLVLLEHGIRRFGIPIGRVYIRKTRTIRLGGLQT